MALDKNGQASRGFALREEFKETFERLENEARLYKYRTSDVIRAAIVLAEREYHDESGEFDVAKFQADAMEGLRRYKGY